MHNWNTRRGPKRRPGPGWDRLRVAILTRDAGRCTIIDGDPPARCEERAAEVDHVRALADGGDDSPQNLRAVCGWHHRRLTAIVANAHKPRYSKKRPDEKHPGLSH